jgi:hypothetical protein
MHRNNDNETGGDVEVMAASQTSGPDVVPSNDDEEPTKANDTLSPEHAESDEGDTTAIDKGPYGAVAILTIDGNFLRSLGFNPDHVDELRYRPYNGAVLVEPVTL